MRLFLYILLTVASLRAFADEVVATSLPSPSDAVGVAHHTFNNGLAFQTDFKLSMKYPSNPVFAYYSGLLDKTWTSCNWGDGWTSFIDGTRNPAVRIHQIAHVWLKPAEKRFISLSVRYISSDKCTSEQPETDEQHVALVEYADADTAEISKLLELSCAVK